MESYVDDVLGKSVKWYLHNIDLRQDIEWTKSHSVHLKPTKCVLIVKSGKFLGFIISEWGIEFNSEILKVIEEMKAPTWHKEVQTLNGRLVALNRFLSKLSIDWSLLFFQKLRV